MLNWPVGLGASGNEGVSTRLEETPGSIGYFELTSRAAKTDGLRSNQKNRDGYYVAASLDSMTDALASSSVPDDFRFSMVNAPGRNAIRLPA
jgi:phosphate transport system substrate-binding protein